MKNARAWKEKEHKDEKHGATSFKRETYQNLKKKIGTDSKIYNYWM